MLTMILRFGLAACAILGIGQTAAAGGQVRVPTFVEEAASAGLDSAYRGDWEFMVGGGAATFDCNSDGFADMLLAGGEAPAKFYRNASTQGGALRFELKQSGLELDKVTGAYPLDVDSDGIMDLILLRVGENVAMRGLGECRFERANEAWNFDGGDGWTTALTATWEHGASWPTIAVGNYIDRKEETSPWGSCTDNWLHRPAAAEGKFGPPFALKPSFCPLSMLFTDWNNSGTPSLRVSNDREYYEGGQEQMWRVDPGQPPKLYADTDGWKPLRIWGMGIASYDLNFDGYPEYFLTSMADNKLQTLTSVAADGPQKPDFKDVAFAKGVTAHRPYTGGDWHPSTAWHAQFEDVNNDGLVDLFVAKGNVDKMPDFATKDPSNLLLQLPDGKFQEAGEAAGIVSFAIARGGMLTDFNMDGLLDLVVVNRRENVKLWRNTSGDAGHWLEIKLEQDGTNRDAIGAKLDVQCDKIVLSREITVGGGHASGSIGWRHFGLGSLEHSAVRVVWPDGQTSDWQKVDTDKFYLVARGKAPVEWTAR
jgi:hypothetical protein